MIHLGAALSIPLLIGGVPRIGLPFASQDIAPGALALPQRPPVVVPGGPRWDLSWKALNGELLELTAELDRANELASRKLSSPAVEELMPGVQEHAVELSNRRARISLALGKESGR
jgi:hypothetical protein